MATKHLGILPYVNYEKKKSVSQRNIPRLFLIWVKENNNNQCSEFLCSVVLLHVSPNPKLLAFYKTPGTTARAKCYSIIKWKTKTFGNNWSYQIIFLKIVWLKPPNSDEIKTMWTVNIRCINFKSTLLSMQLYMHIY